MLLVSERGPDVDKAGKKYWDDLWAGSGIPNAVDPSDLSLKNWINRRYDRLFRRLFANSNARSMRLLEIGCGRSAWLPYFAKEFGFSVSGIDYSPIGCEMARAILLSHRVEADVVCADLFSPPLAMLGVFDVVVSFGVVEHFENTSAALMAISSFLKPGGMLITTIPNMVGWIGAIQKAFNRPVYDIHQLLDPSGLRQAHEQAGLEVAECGFFVFTNFGVNNLAGIPTGSIARLVKKACLGIMARLSMVVWVFEDVVGDLRPSRFISPYIRCVAHKP